MVAGAISQMGVIGHPIGQTLSPPLHGRWIKAHGLTADYHAVDGESLERFPDIVRDCAAKGWFGLNVTIPFKGAAVALADEASPVAEAIGAANLLKFEGNRILADNTDMIGFAEAVRQSGWDLQKETVLLVGAGGAAPAVVYALQDLGFSEILITNRTMEKAYEIKDRFQSVTIVPWEKREDVLPQLNLLINATSLGMRGQPPLPLSLSSLPASAAIVDIVTTPAVTPLMREGIDKGCRAMNGVPMLVHQAIPTFAAWHGITPDDPVAAGAFLQDVLAAKL